MLKKLLTDRFLTITEYCIDDLDTARILKEVKNAIVNNAQIHPSDAQRVARIFYKELQTNGWYGMDEVQQVVDSLDGHSEFNKEEVLTIASVIQMLKDQP